MKAQNGSTIDIIRIGIDVKHDSRFVIKRPRGSGDYLFLHFTTPIHIYAEGKNAMPKKRPVSCILPVSPSGTAASLPGSRTIGFISPGTT